MPKKYFQRYSNFILSGWIVILIDVTLLSASILLANLFRFDFILSELEKYHFFSQLFTVIIIGTVSLLLTGSHHGIIRHTGQYDALRIFWAVTLTVILIAMINYLFNIITSNAYIIEWKEFQNFRMIPNSVLLIFYPIGLFLLLVFRMSIKMAYYSITAIEKGKKINILIYGAGKVGLVLKNTIIGEQSSNYHVIGFIDDHQGKIGKSIAGTTIYSSEQLSKEFIDKREIREIIMAMPNINEDKRLEIYNRLLDLDVNIRNVPAVDQWIGGKLALDQIHNLKIEDLLQRDPIKLGNKSVYHTIAGKTVMVTGAAGSIGSELSRQLLFFRPRKLIFIDQAESPLFWLEQELKLVRDSIVHADNHQTEMEFLIADVSNEPIIHGIINSRKPQILYHAAAYKHVPLMEANPLEAIRVNVFGTCNLANAACENQVEKFIMVSTDKAVNPTSIMGASKRLAEIYIQTLNSKSGNKTAFITTRFGNVLGSNGSVTETFTKQIEAGGPVKVTHPEITRYFMTIPEACQLIFEAGAMGNGGEIYIFDMGDSVKIVDLAKNMIRLSGHVPGKDIMIEFTGLRPGEKLFEELLNDKELTKPTHHPKILIGKVREYSFEDVLKYFNELMEPYQKSEVTEVVRKMKQIIPEYESKNSVFSSLD